MNRWDSNRLTAHIEEAPCSASPFQPRLAHIAAAAPPCCCCKRTSTPGGVRAVTLPWSMPCHVFSYTGLSPRRASIVIEFMQRQLQVYDDANDNETGCVNPTFFYFAR